MWCTIWLFYLTDVLEINNDDHSFDGGAIVAIVHIIISES